MTDDKPRPTYQRQTAKICSTQDLFTGEYVVLEGWNPNYVRTQHPFRKLSRVNIIGFIVDKPTPYQFLLDDGTGSIIVIDFSQNEKTATLKIGEPVLVVGRPRLAENNIFIAAEIATSTQLKEEPAWITYRKEQLQKLSSEEDKEEDNLSPAPEEFVAATSLVEEIAVSPENLTGDLVFDFVKAQDDGEGCDIESVIAKFGQEADDIIFTLISMGEIYEAKPGKLKVLE